MIKIHCPIRVFVDTVGVFGFKKTAEAPASWKPRGLSVRLVNSYHQNIRSWLGLTTNNPYIGW